MATLSTLSEEGCTLQVHQPQRFNNHLARIISAMETQLGCLVGSNAYLTPKGHLRTPASSPMVGVLKYHWTSQQIP